jgi:hypothetical protein
MSNPTEHDTDPRDGDLAQRGVGHPDEIDPGVVDPNRCSEPLEDDAGEPYVICQENVGAEQVIGGGEFPDPNTPPTPPAPGAS